MVEEIWESSQRREPPTWARAIFVGCAVGAIASMSAVVATMRLLDVAWTPAIYLGLFIGFWGGIGFGSMVGGVVHADRLERLAAAGRDHDRG